MIEMTIAPREAVLTGDMRVHRILPFRARRMVGPFTFLDEMGPLSARPGDSGDVPPHPHIGLSTVTWLFQGEFLHRDSLGNVQSIRPGELNWMTAGSGIAHSERIPAALREQGVTLHGLQAWVALPLDAEESSPSFQHLDREQLPRFEVDGCSVCVIAGSAWGRTSPVKTHSPLFYVEATITAGRTLRFDPHGDECAFYLVRGRIEVAGQTFDQPTLIVFEGGREVEITAHADTLGMLLGGTPLEGPRTIWWNFVSSSKERIEEAKQRWSGGRFPPVPGETEFVPLPGTPTGVERSTLP